MPIYEYRCGGCQQVSSFFVRSISTPLEPVCSHCGGVDLQRRMSSFAMGKTADSVHNGLPSNPNSPQYYSDPRNIGRHVEEGFKRYGIDMPQGVKETIEAARDGDLPKGMNS